MRPRTEMATAYQGPKSLAALCCNQFFTPLIHIYLESPAEVRLFISRKALMIDEVTLEELRSRAGFEKMDEAFCAALLDAIEAGQETAPTGVCTAPGTRWPTSCLGPTFN
jgi:hypothetical protein